MGREQGDEAHKSATFVRNNPDTGEQETREAYSAEDEVNLRARGWVQTSERPDGVRRVAPAAAPVAARGDGQASV